MGNIKIGNAEVSIGSILIAVGAVAALISLFLGYITIETYEFLSGWESESVSGMDIITGGEDGTDGLSFVHWAPLIVVITAIIGLIMAIIPMFAKLSVDKKVYNIIITVVMAVSVIFAIIFVAMGAGEGLYTGEAADVIKGFLDSEMMKISLGAGAFIGLIGAIVGLIGAAIGIKESL